MTKRLRVMALSAVILAICTGTVSAYNSDALTVTLNYDGNTRKYLTFSETVTDLLDENNVELYEGDDVDKHLDYVLQSQDTVTITRSIPVVINLDGVPRMVKTTDTTVGMLMESLEGTLSDDYILNDVTEETEISDNMVIDITSKKENIYTVSENIPFETEIKNNDDMAYGTERIVQEGSFGEVEITMKETYLGKEKVSLDEVSRTVTKPATNTIVEKGTAQMLATSAGNFKYEKAINVSATGYTPYDPGCNGITATGAKAQKGVIAVDPRVIPMGTKLYVPGYGMAVAADTGGAIKGNRIDLCYESVPEALNWGVRDVTVYIVE